MELKRIRNWDMNWPLFAAFPSFCEQDKKPVLSNILICQVSVILLKIYLFVSG
jgi:hypothetical protein